MLLGRFFLKKLQDTWQNFQSRSYYSSHIRISEYFMQVRDGIILPDKLLTLASQWLDNNSSLRKSISECFIFHPFTSHILFNGKIEIFPQGLFLKKVCKGIFCHTLISQEMMFHSWYLFWKKLIQKSESEDLLKKAPPDSEAKQAAIL